MTRQTTNQASEADTPGAQANWLDRHRSDLAWLAVVEIVYVATTIAVAMAHPEYTTDRQ